MTGAYIGWAASAVVGAYLGKRGVNPFAGWREFTFTFCCGVASHLACKVAWGLL